MRIINPALVVLSVSAGLGDSIPSESYRLTLEDIVSVEGIRDTALSPDGKMIAIVRGGQIAWLSSEGGWPVTLTVSTGGKAGLVPRQSQRSCSQAKAAFGQLWSSKTPSVLNELRFQTIIVAVRKNTFLVVTARNTLQ